ncbi:MAG TPA: hypothetical protein VMI56_25190 [Reyranella sp.]|nr:hypothetical protein [Reyranella sp.]
MFDRTPASIEMRTPAILSAAVHVIALVAAIVNLNLFSHPPTEPEPVMVDFVKIDKKAAAPKVGLQDPQPKDAKIADETSKAPPPKTVEPPPAPETPKPEVKESVPIPPKPEEKPKAEEPKPSEDKIALKPKEPEPPKVEKPPEPKPTPPKPEVKKVEPPKAAPVKPQPKKDKVDNIVESILKNEEKTPPIKTPQQAPQRPKEITRQVSMAPDLASVVTASEIEGVRQKIRPCWNFIGGAKDSDQLVVSLVVEMNQNGTPVSAEIKDRGRYNSDPLFRAAADSAYRAVLNPRCQPWPLSPDKYNSWRTITFNFDPRDY